jgi:hypothetical protein
MMSAAAVSHSLVGASLQHTAYHSSSSSSTLVCLHSVVGGCLQLLSDHMHVRRPPCSC